MIHTFSGNPLDRADAQRRDPDWISRAANHFSSRFLLFSDLRVLLDGAGLGWLSLAEIEAVGGLEEPREPPILLGLADAIAHFAAAAPASLDPKQFGGSWQFDDCRMAAMRLPGPDTGIVAQARAQLGWHERHRYCSVCGQPTEPGRGGLVRTCNACKAEHFPRTDPVVIMLIDDGERCLLGQPHGPLVRMGMYSALAGFMDQGESIEEAVRREVREEAGIEVGEVRYHSSQPWPFPSSLMIGCRGRAETVEIHIDNEELADVRWFERSEVVAVLAQTHPRLKAPGPMAIAHHLLRDWVGD